jgi:hypothetical protein
VSLENILIERLCMLNIILNHAIKLILYPYISGKVENDIISKCDPLRPERS